MNRQKAESREQKAVGRKAQGPRLKDKGQQTREIG